jgi:hypothetical protein
MTLSELRLAWSKWMLAEHCTRLAWEAFENIVCAGEKIISDDPEHWERQSMWKLYDAAHAAVLARKVA